jgi:hypothetical protein
MTAIASKEGNISRGLRAMICCALLLFSGFMGIFSITKDKKSSTNMTMSFTARRSLISYAVLSL